MKKRILLTLLVLLVAAVPSAAQGPGTPFPFPSPTAPAGSTLEVHYAEPPPAPGWVPVVIVLVESGCYGTQCGSNWTPDPQRYVFEYPADRVHLASGEGDGTPPTPLWVKDPRAKCLGTWAAGTWYHNAEWETWWEIVDTYTAPYSGSTVYVWQEHWGNGPLRERWNFAEDDRCPQATPTPELATPTPRPTDYPCQGTETRTTPPTVRVWVEPPYPVVISQDPEKKGVNVHIQITTYPVIYRWEEYEIVGRERKCAWHDERGNVVCYYKEFGCYNGPTNPCDAGWENWWKETVDKWDCRWHSKRIPDPPDVANTSLEAVLSQGSRQWIREELAQRYPGLKLRHPDWRNMHPHWDVSYYDDGTYVASTVMNIPVEDPGIYDLTLSGRTRGTIHSNPLPYGYQGSFSVYFVGETLVK